MAEGDWTPQGGATATRLLLERSPGLTAIFVHSDVMAIGVLSALWQAGRRVPADVAVVSCDDIPFAEFLTPPLTTVRVPLAETGRQAVELLLRSIAGEPVPERTPLLPVELIVRDSCGAPDGHRREGEGSVIKEAPVTVEDAGLRSASDPDRH